MFRIFAAAAMGIFLSGCASTIGTFYNRPVVEDSVETTERGILSTMSLSADRRTVVVLTSGPKKGKFCAEPPPDTATGLKTELEASLKAKAKLEKLKTEAEGEAGLKDKLETTVNVLADRTPALDMFRTGVYALCQYNLNGVIEDTDVKPLFIRLVEAFEIAHGAEVGKTKLEQPGALAKNQTESSAKEKK